MNQRPIPEKLERLFRLEEMILIGVFWLMAVMTLIQVIARYGLHIGAPWAEELARHSMVYLIMLGIGLAHTRGSHIICDVKPTLMRNMTSVVENIDKALDFLLLSICGYLSWSGVSYLLTVIRSGEHTIATGIPLYAITWTIPAGFIIYSIHLIITIIMKWRHRKG